MSEYKRDADGRWPSETMECRVANAIWEDINDRSGFDLGALDEGTQEEIFNAWVELIKTNSCQISIQTKP